MIISDEHRFVFVHIPKCAGTSVRRVLRPIDTTGLMFNRIEEHPLLGRMHFAHVTLRDLFAHFPEAYEKVRDYRSVAIVREPVDRFFSAIFQRLREFRGYAQSKIGKEVIEAEARTIIAYLESQPERLDLEHVHFNRQTDFIELDGEQIVDRIFPVRQMDDAARFIAEATGIEIGEQRRNRTTEMSFNALKPLQRLLRDPYAKLVPAQARTDIRERMTAWGFYKDVTKQRFVEPGSEIDLFIRRYYARDFALYEQSLRPQLAAEMRIVSPSPVLSNTI